MGADLYPFLPHYRCGLVNAADSAAVVKAGVFVRHGSLAPVLQTLDEYRFTIFALKRGLSA